MVFYAAKYTPKFFFGKLYSASLGSPVLSQQGVSSRHHCPVQILDHLSRQRLPGTGLRHRSDRLRLSKKQKTMAIDGNAFTICSFKSAKRGPSSDRCGPPSEASRALQPIERHTRGGPKPGSQIRPRAGSNKFLYPSWGRGESDGGAVPFATASVGIFRVRSCSVDGDAGSGR